MKLIRATRKDIKPVFLTLKNSLSEEEVRPYNQFANIFGKDKYVIYNINADSTNVGNFCVWELDDYCFIECFAIKSEFRNNGFGSKALTELKKLYKKIILEVELPVDELTKRRIGFYKRNGFLYNDFYYEMPSYVGGKSIPLKIMTYPNLISENDDIINKMYKFCYEKEKNN